MPITWRTVTAPNQNGANSLIAQGTQTILGSLGSLSDRLRAPQREAQEREAAALDRALRQATVNQGQQRIDNQTNQFDRTLTANQEREANRAAALLTAADLENERDNARASRAHQNALDVLKVRQEAQTERSRIEAQSKASSSNKGKKVNLLPFADRVIKNNEDNIDEDSKRAITGLTSFLQGEIAKGNVTQADAEAAILGSFQSGFFNDNELLTGSLSGEFNNAGFQRFLKERRVGNAQSALNQEQSARDKATQEELRELTGFQPRS